MVIKKRPVKAAVKKNPAKAKFDLFAKRIDDLCNRLQATPTKVRQTVADELGCRVTELTDRILLSVSSDIRTYQINFLEGGTIHVHLWWEDDAGKRKYGYLRPRVDAFYRSPSMDDAVIICYMHLCKQVGKFV